jgi:hypothetical protein
MGKIKGSKNFNHMEYICLTCLKNFGCRKSDYLRHLHNIKLCKKKNNITIEKINNHNDSNYDKLNNNDSNKKDNCENIITDIKKSNNINVMNNNDITNIKFMKK